MFRKSLIAPFLQFLVLCALFSLHANAGTVDEDRQWLADKARLEKMIRSENLDEEEECQVTWDILWSWAKKGNLEARATLFRFAYPNWPGVPQIFLPGRSGDKISSRRDAIILGIHSIGVQYDDEHQQEIYNEHSNEIYGSFLNDAAGGMGFLNCLKTTSKQDCARAAFTKANLIPPFNDYAAEIDALVQQGMKAKCIHFQNETWGN